MCHAALQELARTRAIEQREMAVVAVAAAQQRGRSHWRRAEHACPPGGAREGREKKRSNIADGMAKRDARRERFTAVRFVAV